MEPEMGPKESLPSDSSFPLYANFHSVCMQNGDSHSRVTNTTERPLKRRWKSRKRYS